MSKHVNVNINEQITCICLKSNCNNNYCSCHKNKNFCTFDSSQNKTNRYGFATVRSVKPDSIMRELEATGFMSDNPEDISQKPKTLIR